MKRLTRSLAALPALVILAALVGAGTASAHPSTALTVEAKAQKPLVIGIRQVGEVFDPTSTLPSEISAVTVNVIDWMWNRSAAGKIVPGLVTKWTLSEDGKTLDLILRKNVRFHSGDAFTANDIAFSWGRLKAAGFGDRVARTLRQIEVVDDHHAIIRFGAAETGFIPLLGIPVVSKAYHDRVGESTFKTKPVGTGPYKFVGVKSGEYVDLAANPKYWGKKPEVKRARMRFVTEDTTRIAMLKRGEADIIMQVPYQQAGGLDNSDTLRTVQLRPGGFTVFMAFKAQNPQSPWAKREVREAVALAIDRKAIVGKLLKGLPESYAFMSPKDLGYDPTLKPFAYNPGRAKQLLDGAGGGFEVQLPYIAGAATGVKETAEAVALYLQQVGIRATPVALEGPRFVQFVLGASRDPKQDYMAIFIGGLAGKPEPTIGLVSQFSAVTPFAWYRNPQVNGMVLQAAGTVNDQARAGLIKQVGKLIYADVGFVPLWNSVNIYGMKSCIDFIPTPGDFDLMLVQSVSRQRCPK